MAGPRKVPAILNYARPLHPFHSYAAAVPGNLISPLTSLSELPDVTIVLRDSPIRGEQAGLRDVH